MSFDSSEVYTHPGAAAYDDAVAAADAGTDDLTDAGPIFSGRLEVLNASRPRPSANALRHAPEAVCASPSLDEAASTSSCATPYEQRRATPTGYFEPPARVQARWRAEAGDPFGQTEKDFARQLRRHGELTMCLTDADGVVREHHTLTAAGLDRRITPRSRADLGRGPWTREVALEWEEGHAKSPTPRSASSSRPWEPPLPNPNKHAGRCQVVTAGRRCWNHVLVGKGFHSRYYAPGLMCDPCAKVVWPELAPARPPAGKRSRLPTLAVREANAEAVERDRLAFGRAVGKGGGAHVHAARKSGDRAALMFVEKTKQLELIAENVAKAGDKELADKLMGCCKRGEKVACGCKAAYYPIHCHERLCPLCAHFDAQELADRVLAVIRERKVPMEKLSMHTLTIKSTQDLLGIWNDLQLYFLRYKALLMQFFPAEFGEEVEIKNDDGTVTTELRFRGAFRCLETTWHDEHGWHAHIHAIIEHDKVDQQLLSDLWFIASGFRGYVMDVRRLYGGSLRKGVREVTKGPVHVTKKVESAVRDEVVKAVTAYIAKASKCADGRRLLELRSSMKGHRLAEAVGQWREVDKEVVKTLAEERKAKRKKPPVGQTCLDCGEEIKKSIFFVSGWERIEVLKRVGKKIVWRTAESEENPPDG